MLDTIVAIVISLSQQKLYAYSSNGSVASFVVSTGKESTPTPITEDKIAVKRRVTDFYGPGYYIKDVPYVMCLDKYPSHCIHPNLSSRPLGRPYSGGCIRMDDKDVKWVFDRTPLNTPVKIVL